MEPGGRRATGVQPTGGRSQRFGPVGGRRRLGEAVRAGRHEHLGGPTRSISGHADVRRHRYLHPHAPSPDSGQVRRQWPPHSDREPRRATDHLHLDRLAGTPHEHSGASRRYRDHLHADIRRQRQARQAYRPGEPGARCHGGERAAHEPPRPGRGEHRVRLRRRGADDRAHEPPQLHDELRLRKGSAR